MIPIRHTLVRTRLPIVTRTLVAVNVAVFLTQLASPALADKLISTFGFIPARLIYPEAFKYALWEAVVTLLTSLFLHGGFVHLFGNMIYLWVFGDAVEDQFGHAPYLLFYLTCGALGSVTHTFLFPHSLAPSIGASGSIAGILGAFLVLAPRARIITVFPLVVYWAMAEIRATLFLPIWFSMQFLNGYMSLGAAVHTPEVTGVAWWAHVGGFLFGALVAAGYRWSRPARAVPVIPDARSVPR
jgi:membrane associated rhomboid family serine protease